MISKVELKKLFDGIANEGYIYTDIKQANMCEFNVIRKNKVKSKHFVFVDFDDAFIYPYKGFIPSFGFNVKEVVSDIMEFMFIAIELNMCGRKLNCVFCDNSINMARRLNELIDKYEDTYYPLISGRKQTTLLELVGANVPVLSPLEMLSHYLLYNKVEPQEISKQVIIYDTILQLIRAEKEED